LEHSKKLSGRSGAFAGISDESFFYVELGWCLLRLAFCKGGNLLKKTFLWVLFFAALLLLLFYYFGASGVDYAIIVNGEQLQGLPEVAFAAGWLLVCGLAAVGGLALVALILAGTSLVLLGAMAFFFLALLFLFSPLLVPVAAGALLIALFVRRGKR
jgi:hypothetical protein